MPHSPFVFAVIADSHFHPEDSSAPSTYPSDATHNDRNRAVVEILRHVRPAFIVHLGDVPHPIPGLQAHEAALNIAHRAYDTLPAPLYVVPGNHDVGDKPQPWAPAPSVNDAKHAVFESHWGPPFQSFDYEGCHFVLLDTPILNSGIPLEDEQRRWLEQDLARCRDQGLRLFVFVHYPPYLLHQDEPEHYDNIAEPARGWLLNLLNAHSAEAIFAGHVHHFFYNRHHEIDLYALPSMAFVRPGFAELCRVSPEAENGRDDAGKLGFLLVHVDSTGHKIEPVRTEGARAASPATHGALAPGRPPPPSPLGINLRHAWDQPVDIPCDNLDPFRRKFARNDLAVYATWDLGISLIRLPLADLTRPDSLHWMRALHHRGHRFVLYTVQAPSDATWQLLVEHRAMVRAVEWIPPRREIDRQPGTVPRDAPPLWWSIWARSDAENSGVFSHFSSAGFSVDASGLDAIPDEAEAIVYQVGSERTPWDGIEAAANHAKQRDKMAVVHLRLPRAGEGTVFDDDMAVAHRTTEAFLAAVSQRDCRVILDTFVDHDRGYFPRHALLDRRCDPRPAYHVVRNLNRLIMTGSHITPLPDRDHRSFSVDGPVDTALVILPSETHPLPEGDYVIDLVRGDQATPDSARHRHPLLVLGTPRD